ncbi:AAA family ATPase [Mucilaginibacter auburnensis]|uniref:Helix-turn-helix protein n=1 Tax=Mucilaginibacter auburnensis TaxID=1457233 RepID=A0A2H9VM27_9SPHI|nr:AAA family ATPase [Mucilaginibacter auburnensis]PJJ79355.1 helix-turn-helix protein [Mucilaginibacter auburnensis]
MNHTNTALYSSRPAEIELIRDMARRALTPKQKKQLQKQITEPAPESRDAFILKRAADWLQNNTDDAQPDKLFGDFWYRGELCILFADTNVGKSILAVQIGNALSSGEPIPVLGSPLPAEPVLYFDFELSAAQFESRYSSYKSRYTFNPNFYRVVLNPNAQGQHRFKNYADYMNNALENIIITSGARTVILDNITCLRTGMHAAESAISLMRNLQAIKNKYNLSVLVLAHTPKRNPAKPITRNDLQGSKMLINFADSAFAIGESKTNTGLRYLKQVKQRSGKEYYGAANVCLCRIDKNGNFLQFEVEGFDHETAHLQHYTEDQRLFTERRIMQLHNQGISMRAIGEQIGVSVATVCRLVKRLEREAKAR